MEELSIKNANGKGRLRLLTREHLDGRTTAAKQFDAVAKAICEDLGGEENLSTIEKHMIEAFAGISISLGHIHAKMLSGEKINPVRQAIVVSSMVRVATRLGVRRVARDITPSLKEYLKEQDDDRDDDVDVLDGEAAS